MAIEWTSDLNTGIDVLDNQHRRIVEYINRLDSAIGRHDSNSVGQVIEIFEALSDYCTTHFAFEESLLEKVGYKFAAPHKSVHEIFVKRLARYQEKFNAGEDVARPLQDMLHTWLIQHIKRDDMAYVPDLKVSIKGMEQEKDGGDWLSRSVAGFFGPNA